MKLTAENGAFLPEVREQVLIQGRCGVPGHFRFQENGESCLMCQREQRAAPAMRRACIEKVKEMRDEWRNVSEYDKKLGWVTTPEMLEERAYAANEIIAALEAIEVKGEE